MAHPVTMAGGGVQVSWNAPDDTGGASPGALTHEVRAIADQYRIIDVGRLPLTTSSSPPMVKWYIPECGPLVSLLDRLRTVTWPRQ